MRANRDFMVLYDEQLDSEKQMQRDKELFLILLYFVDMTSWRTFFYQPEWMACIQKLKCEILNISWPFHFRMEGSMFIAMCVKNALNQVESIVLYVKVAKKRLTNVDCKLWQCWSL